LSIAFKDHGYRNLNPYNVFGRIHDVAVRSGPLGKVWDIVLDLKNNKVRFDLSHFIMSPGEDMFEIHKLPKNSPPLDQWQNIDSFHT